MNLYLMRFYSYISCIFMLVFMVIPTAIAQEANSMVLTAGQGGMISYQGMSLKVHEDSIPYDMEITINLGNDKDINADIGDFTVLGVMDIEVDILAPPNLLIDVEWPKQTQSYTVSIPAPIDLPVETPILIASEGDAFTHQGEIERLYIVDTAKVIDGRIVSQSKDFEGVIGGRIIFLYLPPDSSTSTTIPLYAMTIGYVEGTILYEGNPQEGVYVISDTSPFAASRYSDGFYRIVVPLGKPFVLSAYDSNGGRWGAEIGRGSFSYRSASSIPAMSLDISLK